MPYVDWDLIEEVLLVDYESDVVSSAIPDTSEPLVKFVGEKPNTSQ
jgi:hypothetical protein